MSLPCRSLSLALAIGIHAILLAAATGAAHWFYRPPQAATDWGGGGGASVTLAGADSPVPGESGLEGDPDTLPPPPPAPRAVQSPATGEDQSPFSPTHSTRLDAEFGDHAGDADPLIGLAAATGESGTPVFKRAGTHGRHSSAIAAGKTARATIAAAPAAGQGGSARAGLPGALTGKGLPSPDYPPEARRRGEQGLVKVAVEVLPDGALGDIRVISDPGYPLLSDAALAAAEKLRRYPFTPAFRFGQPVRDYLVIPYHFLLQ